MAEHVYTAKINVRSLIEFVLREGDIDTSSVSGSENIMQEGSNMHRKIQRELGARLGTYKSEVPLSYTYHSKDHDISIILEGRADGIIYGSPAVIDEIKTTYTHIEKITEPKAIHLAQVKCYGFMFLAGREPQADIEDTVLLRVTYGNLKTEELKTFDSSYTFDQLDSWFTALMEEYLKWVKMERDWRIRRQRSIKELDFPYPYRAGQKELMTHVYHTIFHNKKLFLEAPTGVGKTLAVIFPALKALGEEKADRIFYLTARNITGTVAENAYSLLRSKGLNIKTVVITAKDKTCFQEERQCRPQLCPYAKGHYDRINAALFALLNEREDYTREVCEDYARKFMVCPFEFALDLSLFCDSIICDYNYAFDPHAYLRRFFASGNPPTSIFLVDESHNLVDRGRSMYSGEVIKEDFLHLKKLMAGSGEKSILRRLDKCNKHMLSVKRDCSRILIPDGIEVFVIMLSSLYEALSEYLENREQTPEREEVLELFFRLRHFLMIYDLCNESRDKYIIYYCYNSKDEFTLRLFCADPGMNLMAAMGRAVSSILFSATLLPIQYYKKLLGGTPEDYEVYAQSSFSPHNRGLFICNDITSKYSERTGSTYQKTAAYITAVSTAKRGNYMVYFPSYSFLNAVLEQFDNITVQVKDGFTLYNNGIITIAVQKEGMQETEKRQFLNLFLEGNDSQDFYTGFCVLGGSFSEGIDLKHDSLIGSIIVGTGLPMVCDENQLLKEYFAAAMNKGMEYAYTYPGFGKVLQAAGRVIRTNTDRGVVVLLDYRFLYSSYRALFPSDWDNIIVADLNNIQNRLTDFWSQHNI